MRTVAETGKKNHHSTKKRFYKLWNNFRKMFFKIKLQCLRISHRLQHIISVWRGYGQKSILDTCDHWAVLHLKTDPILSWKSLQGLNNISRNHCQWRQFYHKYPQIQVCVIQRANCMWTWSTMMMIIINISSGLIQNELRGSRKPVHRSDELKLSFGKHGHHILWTKEERNLPSC